MVPLLVTALVEINTALSLLSIDYSRSVLYLIFVLQVDSSLPIMQLAYDKKKNIKIITIL